MTMPNESVASKNKAFYRQHEEHPRDIYTRIYNDNPDAEEDEITALFAAELMASPTLNRMIISVRPYCGMIRRAIKKRASEANSELDTHHDRPTAESVIDNIHKLMKAGRWRMPNGKYMPQCELGYVQDYFGMVLSIDLPRETLMINIPADVLAKHGISL
jgi:hypothetical protein